MKTLSERSDQASTDLDGDVGAWFEQVREMLSARRPVDVERLVWLCASARRADARLYERVWLPHFRSVGVCVGAPDDMVGLVELVDPWVCWMPTARPARARVLTVRSWDGAGVVGERFELPEGALVLISRAPYGRVGCTCEAMEGTWAPWYALTVADAYASRHHALLGPGGADPSSLRVVDLGSTNGTHLVRGGALGGRGAAWDTLEQITGADLGAHDLVCIGRTEIAVRKHGR